jgi:hypothetical protein
MRSIINLLLIICIPVFLLYLGVKCEQSKDPYEPGMHFDYSIECENGFVYKCLDHRRGTIQVLNSDGTPLRCGDKIY